jgi:hypothetical protein
MMPLGGEVPIHMNGFEAGDNVEQLLVDAALPLLPPDRHTTARHGPCVRCLRVNNGITASISSMTQRIRASQLAVPAIPENPKIPVAIAATRNRNA